MEDGEQKESLRMYRALDLALCLGMGGESSNVSFCFRNKYFDSLSVTQVFCEARWFREVSSDFKFVLLRTVFPIITVVFFRK